jgi:hypothetical protein
MHKICAIQAKDSIAELLDPCLYEILKDYISKSSVASIYEDESHNLILKPDEVIVKIETTKQEDNLPAPFFDFNNSEHIVIKSEPMMEEEENVNLHKSKNDNFEMTAENFSFDQNDNSEMDVCENRSSADSGSDSDSDFDADGIEQHTQITNPNLVKGVEFILNESAYISEDKKNNGKIKKAFAQKLARARGEAYVNHKGELKPAKKMKEPCSCRAKCNEKISDEDRMKNFKNYYDLADIILQKRFVHLHRDSIPKQTCRLRYERRVRNRATGISAYYLDKFNEVGEVIDKVRVCTTMFSNTLDISSRTLQHTNRQISTGVVKRKDAEIKLHERSVLAREYARKITFYHLDRPKNINAIYAEYLQECQSKNIDPLKKRTFADVLSKGSEDAFLRIDNRIKYHCDYCKQYRLLDKDEQVKKEAEYREHARGSKTCWDRYRQNRNKKQQRERKLKEKQLHQQLQQQHQQQLPQQQKQQLQHQQLQNEFQQPPQNHLNFL